MVENQSPEKVSIKSMTQKNLCWDNSVWHVSPMTPYFDIANSQQSAKYSAAYYFTSSK